MKGKVLYIVSIIFIALPWLFLFEVWPIPYYKLSTLLEVLIEGSMFVLIAIILTLLKKDIKRLKTFTKEKRKSDFKYSLITGKLLFVLASLTLFLLGLVLLLIGISFTL